MRFLLDRYVSPLCPLLLVTDDEGALRALDFGDHDSRLRRLLREQYGDVVIENGAAPTSIIRALDAYFAGDFASLDEISVATGGTPFQQAVWRALRTIPPGTTQTYGQIAAQIGRPSASRAVGAANGTNPVAIVVPCHRVIGADGTLTGYGGGLARKQWLLDHERGADRSPRTSTRSVRHKFRLAGAGPK
jgi:methylated-DNA-[protein]-cysteine S-methyltransferase